MDLIDTCGNLLDVARVVRQKCSEVIILFVADDDCWNDRNSGKRDAEVAAKAMGRHHALPVFAIPDRDKTDNKKDFNAPQMH